MKQPARLSSTQRLLPRSACPLQRGGGGGGSTFFDLISAAYRTAQVHLPRRDGLAHLTDGEAGSQLMAEVIMNVTGGELTESQQVGGRAVLPSTGKPKGSAFKLPAGKTKNKRSHQNGLAQAAVVHPVTAPPVFFSLPQGFGQGFAQGFSSPMGKGGKGTGKGGAVAAGGYGRPPFGCGSGGGGNSSAAASSSSSSSSSSGGGCGDSSSSSPGGLACQICQQPFGNWTMTNMLDHVRRCSSVTIDLSSSPRGCAAAAGGPHPKAAGGPRPGATAESADAIVLGGAFDTLELLMEKYEKYLQERVDAGRDPEELDVRFVHLSNAADALKAALMHPSDATKKSAALTACIMIQAKLNEVSGLHRAIEIAMGSQQKPINLVLSSKGHKKGRFSSKKEDPAK